MGQRGGRTGIERQKNARQTRARVREEGRENTFVWLLGGLVDGKGRVLLCVASHLTVIKATRSLQEQEIDSEIEIEAGTGRKSKTIYTHYAKPSLGSRSEAHYRPPHHRVLGLSTSSSLVVHNMNITPPPSPIQPYQTNPATNQTDHTSMNAL